MEQFRHISSKLHYIRTGLIKPTPWISHVTKCQIMHIGGSGWPEVIFRMSQRDMSISNPLKAFTQHSAWPFKVMVQPPWTLSDIYTQPLRKNRRPALKTVLHLYLTSKAIILVNICTSRYKYICSTYFFVHFLKFILIVLVRDWTGAV